MNTVVPKENCSHPVPENQYGVMTHHCFDNRPISLEDLKGFFAECISEAHSVILDDSKTSKVAPAKDDLEA